MRLNTIDDNYIMIPIVELTQVAYNSTEPREIKFAAMDMYRIAQKYSSVDYKVEVIGVRKTPELLDMILNEHVSLKKLSNALMYTVFHETDETIVEDLKELMKTRKKIRLKDLRISKQLEDFIIKNGDYDYIEDINPYTRQDEDFFLYEDNDMVRITLNKERYIPKLENTDVK